MSSFVKKSRFVSLSLSLLLTLKKNQFLSIKNFKNTQYLKYLNIIKNCISHL